MFLAKYELNGKKYFNIYYNNINGWKLFYKDTFPPETKNIVMLMLEVKGVNYKEQKLFAEELAKEYQREFSSLSWSYSELTEICNYFETIGKRYGLLKEFHENCIC